MDIIVATDYMLNLANFFTNDIVGANEEVVKSQVVIAKASSHTMSQAKLKKVTQEVIDAPVTSMTINLRMEQPDIVLVETTDQRNVDAVVCNVSIFFPKPVNARHIISPASFCCLDARYIYYIYPNLSGKPLMDLFEESLFIVFVWH